jgi:hypothetical protein
MEGAYPSLYGTLSQRQNQRCDDLDANVTQRQREMVLKCTSASPGSCVTFQRSCACEPVAAPCGADEAKRDTRLLRVGYGVNQWLRSGSS